MLYFSGNNATGKTASPSKGKSKAAPVDETMEGADGDDEDDEDDEDEMSEGEEEEEDEEVRFLASFLFSLTTHCLDMPLPTRFILTIFFLQEDNFEEIDPSVILPPGSRRTRGTKVDYTSAEAIAKAGLKPEDLNKVDSDEEVEMKD